MYKSIDFHRANNKSLFPHSNQFLFRYVFFFFFSKMSSSASVVCDFLFFLFSRKRVSLFSFYR